LGFCSSNSYGASFFSATWPFSNLTGAYIVVWIVSGRFCKVSEVKLNHRIRIAVKATLAIYDTRVLRSWAVFRIISVGYPQPTGYHYKS
jgi:hypothetical protein